MSRESFSQRDDLIIDEGLKFVRRRGFGQPGFSHEHDEAAAEDAIARIPGFGDALDRWMKEAGIKIE